MFKGWDTLRLEKMREQARAFERNLLLRISFHGPVMVNHEAHQESKMMRLDDWTNNLLLYDYDDPTSQRTGIKIANISSSSSAPIITSTRQNQQFKQKLADMCWYPFDSGMFMTCHAKGSVRVWDTLELKEVRNFPLQTPCNRIAMSPVPSSHSALMAVACHRGEIRLIDLYSANFAQTLQIDPAHSGAVMCNITSVSWSPRSEHVLASADTDARVLLWDIRKPNKELCALDEWNQDQQHANKKMRCFAHRSAVKHVQFVQQSKALVTCDEEGMVRLWRESQALNHFSNTQLCFRALQTPCSQAIAYSANTDLLFVGDKQHIKCFDGKRGGEPLAIFAGHADNVRSIALREQHQEMYSLADDGFIIRWKYTAPSSATATVSAMNENDEDNWSD